MPGSTAATPYETRRAIGCTPFFSAHALSATIMAAAPLLSPGEFPAVIVPSLRNAGFSLASVSMVVSGPVVLVLLEHDRPLPCLGTSTATISASNLPAA